MAREGHGNSLMANHPDDVVFISVMLDANSTLEQGIQNWVTEFGIEHPILADDSGVTSSYVTAGFPTFVIIDQNMVIQNADLWPYDESFITNLF